MDDSVLLERWRAGDDTAGTELLKSYYDVLYRFFANKVESEAEDLVQVTMMAVLSGRDRFEMRSTFRAYLLSIGRFQLYEHYRKKKRREAVLEYDTVSAFDLGPSPSVHLAAQAEQRLLLEALRRIPVNFQIALELHYWEDLSGPELAEVLNVPVDTAYSRLRKARELLKKKMKVVSSGVDLVRLQQDEEDESLDDEGRALKFLTRA
jgi:RNA polymerase sigma factor (sigma-70 family)